MKLFKYHKLIKLFPPLDSAKVSLCYNSKIQFSGFAWRTPDDPVPGISILWLSHIISWSGNISCQILVVDRFDALVYSASKLYWYTVNPNLIRFSERCELPWPGWRSDEGAWGADHAFSEHVELDCWQKCCVSSSSYRWELERHSSAIMVPLLHFSIAPFAIIWNFVFSQTDLFQTTIPTMKRHSSLQPPCSEKNTMCFSPQFKLNNTSPQWRTACIAKHRGYNFEPWICPRRD